ncbi:hypothetical protein Gyru_ORF21 [Gynaephora ruoergensis nucleopolyhedrovirus]|nr:hypothetical protein Gyru_ORF21 [Gynaephora ruoergensis nucleopolyhedrovirus]
MSLKTLPIELLNKISSHLSSRDVWNLMNALRRAVDKKYCRYMFAFQKKDRSETNNWCANSGLFKSIATGTIEYGVDSMELCEICNEFGVFCTCVDADACYECKSLYCYCFGSSSPILAKPFEAIVDENLTVHRLRVKINKNEVKYVKYVLYRDDLKVDVSFAVDIDRVQEVRDALGEFLACDDAAKDYVKFYYKDIIICYKYDPLNLSNC